MKSEISLFVPVVCSIWLVFNVDYYDIFNKILQLLVLKTSLSNQKTCFIEDSVTETQNNRAGKAKPGEAKPCEDIRT